MSAASPVELLDRADRRWTRYTATIEANAGTNIHGEGHTAWTAPLAYSHFAYWWEWSLAALRAHLRGEPIPGAGEDYRVVNARRQAEDADLPLEEARGRAILARAALVTVLRQLPPERWDDYVREIAEDHLGNHVAEHIGFTGAVPAAAAPV